MNFYMVQSKVALFFPAMDFADKLALAVALKEAAGGKLDGETAILPLDREAPSEIPRIRLGAKDERFILDVCGERLDLTRLFKEEREERFPIPAFFETLYAVAAAAKEKGCRFIRCGFVTDWVGDVNSSGAPYLQSVYVKEPVQFESPLNFEIHVRTKRTVGGLEANQWTRLKSARKIADLAKDTFVDIHCDINTPGEQAVDFSADLLECFLAASAEAMNQTIGLHRACLERR